MDDGLARHTTYWYRLTPDDGQGTPVTLETQTAAEPVAYAETGAWAEGELAQTVIDYDYDELYRLTAADYNDGKFFHYAYDSNGNRLSETTPLGEVLSTYDAANQLTSVGGAAYTWDDNGNLTSDGTSQYNHDHANRLVQVTTAGATTEFEYNGLGERLVEDGTPFVMDLNSGLTQALSDGTNSYLYGSGRIGQFSGVETAYFLGDALGSVRQLVNGNGVVSLVKSYEPYGKMAGSTGSSDTAYSFTGEWQSTAEMLYLRARFYNLTWANGFSVYCATPACNNTCPSQFAILPKMNKISIRIIQYPKEGTDGIPQFRTDRRKSQRAVSRLYDVRRPHG